MPMACDSQLFSSTYVAAVPVSPVRIRIACSSSPTKMRPSPVRPVLRDVGNRLEHRFDDGIIDGDFDFGPRSELCFVDFGDGDALNAQLRDGLPQLVQLEWPHDRGDHFHEVHFAMIEP